MSDEVEQTVAQGGDRPGEAAGELLEGGVELSRIPGVDDSQHGLGPREIDAAGEKCTESEFPGSAWRAPRAKQCASTRLRSGTEPAKWISATS